MKKANFPPLPPYTFNTSLRALFGLPKDLDLKLSPPEYVESASEIMDTNLDILDEFPGGISWIPVRFPVLSDVVSGHKKSVIHQHLENCFDAVYLAMDSIQSGAGALYAVWVYDAHPEPDQYVQRLLQKFAGFDSDIGVTREFTFIMKSLKHETLCALTLKSLTNTI